MNRLILIRGPICAGKSTTASLLRDNIEKCSLVDQDCLKRAIDNKEPTEWRDQLAFDTSLYLADLLMKKGRDIVADIHSSIPKQYNEYEKLATKNNYKLFSFLLYPPLNTCQERNRVREIPDIQYEVTEDDIKKYWKNVHKIKGETVFDTSIIEANGIIKKILEVIA
ncbi:MAG: AAA family ATPase [Candidatus Vogelbacteria bacterium]|nr:AAA family ATPase [Candidatus Vogelbacteria bacterium]